MTLDRSSLARVREGAPAQLTPGAALDAALDEHRPECRDVDLFTADTPTPADRAAMALVCISCPVFPECADYAEAERPRAGFWAGRFRGGRA
ncbi:WhiB family transcriptional regulator [Microbacterium sp. che218]|uniref:WhiB family transcriptional regulator n=1 Tax=Microbacterium sp. che218 TaxID=3140649 RepID=UPI0033675B5A